jgi:NAD(P) transhydrogenase subunit alpha
MASQSSQLYGSNLCHLLDDMGKNAGYRVDENDEVVRGALILRDGELKWPPPEARRRRRARPAAPRRPPKPAACPPPSPPKGRRRHGGHHGPPAGKPGSPLPLFLAGAALIGVGLGAPPAFLSHFTVFVLACFIGYQVVWNVAPALHTPLMSVTNAISGIIIIGGMLQVSGAPTSAATILGAIASCWRPSTSPAASSSPSACSRCSASRQGPVSYSLLTVTYIAASALFIMSLGGLSGRRPPAAATSTASSAC